MAASPSRADITAAWDAALGSLPLPVRTGLLGRCVLLECERTGTTLTLSVAAPNETAAAALTRHAHEIAEVVGSSTGARVEVVGVVDPDRCLPPPPPADLVAEAIETEVTEARQAGELAYYARIIAQVGLPYTAQPGNEFIRVNGDLKVSFVAPGGIGLPYGVIPRLLMCWLTTEAVRTQQPELRLGHTLTGFLDRLQLGRTGGAKGDITRLRQQMTSLFASTITAIYSRPGETALKPIPLAEEVFLWWDATRPAEPVLWNSTITLSEPFFRQVVERPIPIRLDHLQQLRRSPMALDMYVWLTHRLFYLKGPTTVPTELLMAQLGGSPGRRPRDFRADLVRHLAALRQVWPELDAQVRPGGLYLRPSPGVIHRGSMPAQKRARVCAEVRADHHFKGAQKPARKCAETCAPIYGYLTSPCTPEGGVTPLPDDDHQAIGAKEETA
ncbi:MAG: replication protein RepA [Candidatus Dormibacteria bacterium]